MKETMNSRNIARFHKMLRADVPIAKCSKILRITTGTLKKFTPEAFKKAGVSLNNVAKNVREDVKEVTGTAAADKPATAIKPAAAAK